MLTRNAGANHEINLSEEEISDVSLATFYVVDNEGAAPSGRRARLAMGCGGCGGGCGGCGGCSSNSDYQAPTTWGNAGTLSVSPARKAVRTPKRTSGNEARKLTSDVSGRAGVLRAQPSDADDGARRSLRNASTPSATKDA